MMIDKKQFGTKLRLVRKLVAKRSQEDAALSIGVNVSVYAQWERGEYLPNLENFVKICNEFAASPAYLLGDYIESLNITK